MVAVVVAMVKVTAKAEVAAAAMGVVATMFALLVVLSSFPGLLQQY